MPAKIQTLEICKNQRVICISDIHGELDFLKILLDKVKFNDKDLLIILGDIYSKGSRPHDTLKFCMELGEKPNVHILRGNADWATDDFLSAHEIKWLQNLPDIIDSEEYTFVHSGLSSGNLNEQQAAIHKKFNNFMETAPCFEKWVVVGHWPTAMYSTKKPCQNPIVNTEKRVISIDGGAALKTDGQLNAFIIQDGKFSYESADNLPKYITKKPQPESGGSLSITWNDRFVEVVSDNGALCDVKHFKTGRILTVPKSQIWTDSDGNICICDMATDYHLPCEAGDEVSLVEAFADRVYVKKGGVSGWVREVC